MKVVFNITSEKYLQIVEKFKALNSDDYYTVGEGRHNRFKGDRTLGYVINPDSSVYTTSGFNRWGVRKTGLHFQAFFEGRRSVIHKAIDSMDLDIKAEPRRYESSDLTMFWYEDLYEYLTRKGFGAQSEYLSRNTGCQTSERIKADWNSQYGSKAIELRNLARKRYM